MLFMSITHTTAAVLPQMAHLLSHSPLCLVSAAGTYSKHHHRAHHNQEWGFNLHSVHQRHILYRRCAAALLGPRWCCPGHGADYNQRILPSGSEGLDNGEQVCEGIESLSGPSLCLIAAVVAMGMICPSIASPSALIAEPGTNGFQQKAAFLRQEMDHVKVSIVRPLLPPLIAAVCAMGCNRPPIADGNRIFLGVCHLYVRDP